MRTERGTVLAWRGSRQRTLAPARGEKKLRQSSAVLDFLTGWTVVVSTPLARMAGRLSPPDLDIRSDLGFRTTARRERHGIDACAIILKHGRR
jgi:hypothetical protein